MLKQIEQHLDLLSLREDLKKLGPTFISGGIVGIFLEHLFSIQPAIYLTIIGIMLWVAGLVKRKKNIKVNA